MAHLELAVSADFRARMAIPDHEGACRRPHGYRFVVTVHVRTPLPEANTPWTTDLVAIETALNDAISPLSDGDLAKLLGYPSFEAILLWLVDRLQARMPDLQRVELQAPPRYAVTWHRNVAQGEDVQNS